MLCEVSTSSGATMPGKITMSDRPRMGRTCGTERDEMRPGTASVPPDVAPKMLINSVSGDVMIAAFNYWIAAELKGSGEKNYFPVTATLVCFKGDGTAC